MAKNAMPQHELLAKLKHVNNTARENFITQPHDETLARHALRSEIQLGVPDKLHNAHLTYNGTRARDLIGFISEQVKEYGTPADKKKLDSVSNKLANLAGREKDEEKIAGQLDDLVSKFSRRSGEAFINNFMETYCYPAWLKYHESQGIDVKGKETFNEQLNACSTVLNRRLDVMSEPGKPWVLLVQNMSMLIDECAAVSKALIRHDFDAPPADAQPEKPAATPDAVKATPDGRRFDIHGGADKGGVTLHINNSNSNRNGDISNAPVYPGGNPVAIDPHTRRLEIVGKLNISPQEKYELAKRIIDGCYGSRVIDHIESVRVDTQDNVTEEPPFIPPFVQQSENQPVDDGVNTRPDDADSRRTGERAQDPDVRIPDPARNVSTRALETPPQVEEALTRPQDETSSSADRRSVTPHTPAAHPAGKNKTTQVYTTERTLNQWSRRDPVKVNHFVPMDKRAEEFPTLKPVNGQRLTTSLTPGRTATQLPVDEPMISTNDVMIERATVRQAVLVTSSYQPERSVAELVTLGDMGQAEPSVSSDVDEVDGRVQNAARRGAHEAGDVREETSSSADRRSVTPHTPAAHPAGKNKTTQVYTTERTLNQWSRRDPVKVNHFVPMDKRAEEFPTLKPVNGQHLTTSLTPGRTATQLPVDEPMISTNDVMIERATVRQAVLVTSSYQPERSVAELVTLGDMGQAEPSVSSDVDEVDGRVQNAARRGAHEAGDVREETSSSADRRSVTPHTPAAHPAGKNKTTQVYTTERTLNQWSRRDPVKVNHFVPMDKRAEEFPTLKPVNGQHLTTSLTPGRTATQLPVDEPMISTNDVMIERATVRQAVLVTSSYQPERSVAELVTLGDMGQAEPSVSSDVDEVDGRVQNAARRGAHEAGDVRETRWEEPGAEQQSAAAGASGIPSPQVNAANPYSIAERIRYFEEAQKAGAQPVSGRVSRPTSSTAPGHVYSTIRTRSQWNFDVPEPKSFVPRNADASASGTVRRGDVTNGSVTDTNLAGEYGDE
ncbi:hypothetical protein [Lelliottia sp. WAP21]|uniref:hypothetical protein n=1 Tax=Lelliottia sp. WAP21 TaxID=2877426 RepID=UPI001F285CB6|nr:hypothetical protein [Lelliottia sp. WAP21]